MERMTIRLLVFFLLLVPFNLSALELGEISIHSYLHHKLRAKIPITGLDARDVESLTVKLAPPVEFARAGLDRPPELEKLLFEIQERPEGGHFIDITTRDAFSELFLGVVLEVAWSKGHVVRDYVALIDPAPSDYRPQGFTAFAVTEKRSAKFSSDQESAEYGPVKRGDTLWVIASRLRPDKSISIPKMMDSLLKKNPTAFIDNDINKLKAGHTLAIPSKEMILSGIPVEATPGRQERTSINKKQRPSMQDHGNATASTEKDASKSVPTDRLNILALAPTSEGGVMYSRSADANIESLDPLRKEIAAHMEENLRIKQQNEEMAIKLSLLEEQAALIKKLLLAQTEIADVMPKYEKLVQPRSDTQLKFANSSSDVIVTTPLPDTGPKTESRAITEYPKSQNQSFTSFDWRLLLIATVFGFLVAIAIVFLVMVITRVSHSLSAQREASEADSGSTHNAINPVSLLIAEIDLSIVYGDYNRAEQLIADQKHTHANHPDLMIKLIEISAFTRDKKRFAQYLDKWGSTIRRDAPRAWIGIDRLARSAFPNYPLVVSLNDSKAP